MPAKRLLNSFGKCGRAKSCRSSVPSELSCQRWRAADVSPPCRQGFRHGGLTSAARPPTQVCRSTREACRFQAPKNAAIENFIASTSKKGGLKRAWWVGLSSSDIAWQTKSVNVFQIKGRGRGHARPRLSTPVTCCQGKAVKAVKAVKFSRPRTLARQSFTTAQ